MIPKHQNQKFNVQINKPFSTIPWVSVKFSYPNNKACDPFQKIHITLCCQFLQLQLTAPTYGEMHNNRLSNKSNTRTSSTINLDIGQIWFVLNTADSAESIQVKTKHGKLKRNLENKFYISTMFTSSDSNIVQILSRPKGSCDHTTKQ